MKYPIFIITAALPFIAGACSTSNSGMDTGERISERAGQISNYGDAWSDGQKGARQGQQLVEKSGSRLASAEKDLARARERVARAERRIGDANADRTKGQQLIADGTGQMQRAEESYSAVRSGPSAVTQGN